MKTFEYTLEMLAGTQDFQKQEQCEAKDINEAWDIARQAAWKWSVTARVRNVWVAAA